MDLSPLRNLLELRREFTSCMPAHELENVVTEVLSVRDGFSHVHERFEKAAEHARRRTALQIDFEYLPNDVVADYVALLPSIPIEHVRAMLLEHGTSPADALRREFEHLDPLVLDECFVQLAPTGSLDIFQVRQLLVDRCPRARAEAGRQELRAQERKAQELLQNLGLRTDMLPEMQELVGFAGGDLAVATEMYFAQHAHHDGQHGGRPTTKGATDTCQKACT